jgi:protein TonB
MLASVAVTTILGAVILSGLNVEIVRQAVDRLETFDIPLPEIPPPLPPPPPPKPAQEESGSPAAPKASRIVAHKPEVQLPPRQVIAAAREPGTGASSSAGQGGVGTGTGAGGTGTGAGRGSGAGSTPARLIRNLTNSDYRGLTGNRLPRGSAALALRIDSTGSIDSCRVIRSSGDSVVDSGICGLVTRRLRFSPARDAQGQRIPYSTNYMATWNRR